MPLKGLDNVKANIDQVKSNMNDDLRIIYFKGLRMIITNMPVDEGEARANWFLTEGVPSTQNTDSTDVNQSLNELDEMPVNILDKRMLYTNNKPYIEVLEFGGYPNPPKKGTRLKGGGFEKRSKGGFSRLAPHGMVRIALKKMRVMIKAL